MRKYWVMGHGTNRGNHPDARIVAALERELAGRKDLRWAYLFGSAAEGSDFGDLDVAVMPSEGALESPVECGVLGARLARAAGRGALSVDVVDLRDTPLPFIVEILDRNHLLLDREPESRRLWEFEATLRWLDFAESIRQYDRLRLEALESGEW